MGALAEPGCYAAGVNSLASSTSCPQTRHPSAQTRSSAISQQGSATWRSTTTPSSRCCSPGWYAYCQSEKEVRSNLGPISRRRYALCDGTFPPSAFFSPCANERPPAATERCLSVGRCLCVIARPTSGQLPPAHWASPCRCQNRANRSISLNSDAQVAQRQQVLQLTACRQ